jgi:hypothetical protein
MTYEEGCKIAERIAETGNKEIVGRDVTKHTKPGEGFVITKYNGTFQSVGMDDGLMFYLNHKARVCEVKAQATKAADAPEAEAPQPAAEETPAPTVTESAPAPAAAAPQTTTETTAPETQPVHTVSVNTPKEASMAEANATGNSSIATEYVEETNQLATSLNAFISKLDSDRNVSEQAMRNFIDNPLDSTTISYHAARLSYTKDMLERLRGVAATLML